MPHLAELFRASQSDEERAAFVQEMLVLIDAADQPRYDVLPALRLVCTWLAQRSGGDPSALRRLEKAQEQMQDHQSAASLHEVQAFTARLHGEWAQVAAGYEAAAAKWQALERPYDRLRALAELGEALAHTGDKDIAATVHRQATALVKQLPAELGNRALKEAFMASPLVSRWS